MGSVVVLEFACEPDDRELIPDHRRPIQVIRGVFVSEGKSILSYFLGDVVRRNCHQCVRLRIWIAIQLHKTIAFLSSNAKIERGIGQEGENILEVTMTTNTLSESYLDNVVDTATLRVFLI